MMRYVCFSFCMLVSGQALVASDDDNGSNKSLFGEWKPTVMATQHPLMSSAPLLRAFVWGDGLVSGVMGLGLAYPVLVSCMPGYVYAKMATLCVFTFLGGTTIAGRAYVLKDVYRDFIQCNRAGLRRDAEPNIPMLSLKSICCDFILPACVGAGLLALYSRYKTMPSMATGHSQVAF